MSSKSEQIAERLIARLKEALGWLHESRRKRNPYADKLISLLNAPPDKLDIAAIEAAYWQLKDNTNTTRNYDEFQVIGLCMELLVGWER